jgi:hypothetical protein
MWIVLTCWYDGSNINLVFNVRTGDPRVFASKKAADTYCKKLNGKFLVVNLNDFKEG